MRWFFSNAEGAQRPELEKPLAALYDSGEITGKFLEFTLLHGVAGYQGAPRPGGRARASPRSSMPRRCASSPPPRFAS